jgi:pectinesterase inhibitor-like protein
MSSSDGGQSRKRLIIGVLSVFLLVAMVIGVVAFFVNEKANEAADLHKRTMSTTSRAVDLFCAPTDFHATCQETLESALSKSSDTAEHPHAAAAAAITAVARELASGFNRSTLLDAVRGSNDTLVWEAVHDCRMLLDVCTADVERALRSVAWRGVDVTGHDLQAWLSAVITFQGSCVDMFPKGEIRDQVKDNMQKAREISSNAIAIIQQGAALAAMLDLHTDDVKKQEQDTAPRRLDDDEESVVVPTWAQQGDRVLLEDEDKLGLTPNVTVAKDGTGDFTNISAALDAMPETYVGRYVVYVKEGVYDETVNVSRRMANVTMYGDGSKKSIVTGAKSVLDGIRMWRTATFGKYKHAYIHISIHGDDRTLQP